MQDSISNQTEPMKEHPILQCSLCAEVFKSLMLTRKEAYEEVLIKFTQHMQTKHTNKIKNLMQDVGKITAISATVVLISKYTTLLDKPETQLDNPIYEEFSKLVDEIESILGIDIEIGDTQIGPNISISKEEMEEYPGKELSVTGAD